MSSGIYNITKECNQCCPKCGSKKDTAIDRDYNDKTVTLICYVCNFAIRGKEEEYEKMKRIWDNSLMSLALEFRDSKEAKKFSLRHGFKK